MKRCCAAPATALARTPSIQDISTMAPMRKPSKIPFFTQALTRQPVGEAAIRLRRAHFAAIQRVLELAKEPEMFFAVLRRRLVKQPLNLLRQHALSRQVLEMPARRESALRFPPSARTSGRRHTGSEQTHFRHRRLHRNRIRLHEVYFHQRMDAPVNLARALKCSRCMPSASSCVISAGISFDTTEMTPRPPSAISGSVMASSPRKHDEVVRDGIQNRRHLRDIAGSFLNADDVFDRSETSHRRRLDVYASAALHAVHNDRQRHRVRNRFVVLIQDLPASACCSTASPKEFRPRRSPQVRARARSLRRCCSRPRRPAPAPFPSPAPR